ncbi:MAG: tyrosine-type recombinase/integrase [Candidatus Tectomicrobia bacterium]
MTRATTAITQFRTYLQRRHYSVHTLDSYRFDLQLFFAQCQQPVETVTYRDVEQFLTQQHAQGMAPTTINRRLYAVKHLFDYLLEHRLVVGNPVKPSHFARLGRPLPKALAHAHLQALFAQIQHPMDKALFLLMLRAGLRVSEVVQLKLSQIEWDEQALWIEQGKGRKDRRVYLSADAMASLQACVAIRPPGVPNEWVFWNQKRLLARLSIKAIQKKIERYAQAAGIKASCHSLRHTFASNLLEHGAEIVSIKDLLGHATAASSERYARASNHKVKQEYLRTMKKVMKQSPV